MRPVLGRETPGNEVLDVEPERLEGRVAEDPGRALVPQEDPASGRVRDDHRVPNPAQETTHPEVLQA